MWRLLWGQMWDLPWVSHVVIELLSHVTKPARKPTIPVRSSKGGKHSMPWKHWKRMQRCGTEDCLPKAASIFPQGIQHCAGILWKLWEEYQSTPFWAPARVFPLAQTFSGPRHNSTVPRAWGGVWFCVYFNNKEDIPTSSAEGDGVTLRPCELPHTESLLCASDSFVLCLFLLLFTPDPHSHLHRSYWTNGPDAHYTAGAASLRLFSWRGVAWGQTEVLTDARQALCHETMSAALNVLKSMPLLVKELRTIITPSPNPNLAPSMWPVLLMWLQVFTGD